MLCGAQHNWRWDERPSATYPQSRAHSGTVVSVTTGRSQKLNIRVTEDDDGQGRYVLIEGGKASLEWLAKLIHAHATGQNGCGLQLHPAGPGRLHFAKTATHGVYLHLLPCEHPTDESERLAGRKKRMPRIVGLR